MKILVINCGSSSAKFQLFDIDTGAVLAKGNAERIGIDGKLTYKPAGKDEFISTEPMPDHKVAVKMILDALVDKDHGVIADVSEIAAVGHRVLHGGKYYSASVIVNEDVKRVIRECFPLGPLHNPANLIGIEACEDVLPAGTPQVAVFDTAFHQTMPQKAFMYAIPYDMYENYGVRRYGFHGTSHRYVSARALEFLGMKVEGSKVITAHIGNGGSLAAVKDGKCQDTSMGLTPLEGVMMGTRSGDIDGGAVSFIQKKLGLDADGISNYLNKKSGLAGISCKSSDMREVFQAASEGDAKCKLAIDMYTYRIKKYIGSYAAALGGCDVLVFTAGVCENQSDIREAVCADMEWMGIKLDKEKNAQIHGEEAIISAPDSKVTVVVIPTDEELMIASDTMELVK